MNKDLLDKHQNDTAWAEVVCLYSGLYDTQEERDDFIYNLAETDILLAAECKTSSMDCQDHLQTYLSNKAASLLSQPNPSDRNHLVAIFALSELDRFDIISNYLAKIENREIPFIRNLFKELPSTREAKDLLIASVYSQPTFFIYTLLESIEGLEREGVFLSREEIDRIFEVLVKNDVKFNHLFAYFQKYTGEIENIQKYRDFAIKTISQVSGYKNLLAWLKCFNIRISNKKLIEDLYESQSLKALHNLSFLLEKAEVRFQVKTIEKMLQRNIKTITVALIYLNSHNEFKSKFYPQLKRIDLRMYSGNLDKFSEFYKVFSKVYRKVGEEKIWGRLDEKIKESFKVGDILQCKLISKRLKYYLVMNMDTKEIDSLLTYIIPLAEAPDIMESEVLNKKEISAKIIYIDFSKRKLFLSVIQLDIKSENLLFNQEYLKDINIGELVTCKIGERFDDKVYARIIGMSKKQKAVILGDSKILEGKTEVVARVEEIKSQAIYLSIVELVKNENGFLIPENHNYTHLRTIQENAKIGIVQKILIIVNERYKSGVEFTYMDLYSNIGFISKQPMNSLFPSKHWFLNFLERNNYISKIEEKRNRYFFNKPLDNEIFNNINSELEIQGWQSISSFDKQEVKAQNQVINTNSNTLNSSLKISVNDILSATITNITFFGISLKIAGESRKAAIFISELTKKRLEKINDFEYKGKKLHIGQQVTAKVISIDEKFGINLSLKRIENDKT